MKLHPHVIDKLIFLFENYGGHINNAKLRTHLAALDFTPYEKKTGGQEVVLVLTEEMMKQLGKR
ncbi:MAG: hypothetical protein WC761_01230 [Candidatus Paceibacterota bacterium]|jgi:hypothetical protein